MNVLLILARVRNEAANRWLSEHPVILGLIFLAIGLVAGGWGVYELMTGTARTKHGKKLTGGQAKAMAIIRIVAGSFSILFGLYKMIAG